MKRLADYFFNRSEQPQNAVATDAQTSSAETPAPPKVEAPHDPFIKKPHPPFYTQIFIDPACLPQAHKGADKRDLLDAAWHGVQPYIAFVRELDGVRGRKDLHHYLEVIVKHFLIRYWDMPASEDTHHTYPWGLVLHSLYVACAEAEQNTRWKPFTEYGIDEIRLGRERGAIVLLAFVKGLMHDSHTIYQYRLSAESETGTVNFNALKEHSSILAFKTAFSEYTETWDSDIQDSGALGVGEFVDILPKDLRKYLPKEEFVLALGSIRDGDTFLGDKESVTRDRTLSGRITTDERFFNAFEAYFSNLTDNNPRAHVFWMNGAWTAVDAGQFLEKIRSLVDGVYALDGVTEYLLKKKILAGTKAMHSVTVRFQRKDDVSGKLKAMEKMKLCFISTPFLLEVRPYLEGWLDAIVFPDEEKHLVHSLCKGGEYKGI